MLHLPLERESQSDARDNFHFTGAAFAKFGESFDKLLHDLLPL